MLNSKMLAAAVLAGTMVLPANAQSGKGGPALTTADRAELEVLNARYSLSLGMCNADVWPTLFVEKEGFFASGSRGKMQGQHRLAEMNRSYDCVYVNGTAPDHAPVVLVPYKITIEATRDGAEGFAYYNGGRYEDVYTRTDAGWRFKSRTVMSNRELAAGYSWKDLDDIQRLAAANGGPYEDLYEPTPRGSRLKSAGVALTMEPNGRATGRAYLKDGSHYEDVYVKASGSWRVQSRTLVAPPDSAGKPTTAR